MSNPDPGDDISAADLAAWPDSGPDISAGSHISAGSDSHAADEQARLTAWVQGRVQSVGFRWWVRSNGLELGLVGMAENLTDGRVKVVVEGARENCAALLKRLEGTDTPGKVVQVTFRWDQPRGGFSGFAER